MYRICNFLWVWLSFCFLIYYSPPSPLNADVISSHWITHKIVVSISQFTCTRNNCKYSPLRLMVLVWSGSTRLPSWHIIKVSLRPSVILTIAIDVMDVPGTTSVTLNSNGGSEITPLCWLLGVSARLMPRDGTLHWCAVEEIVHVKVTVSPRHGLSALDCNWANETEKEWHCSYLISIKQSPCIHAVSAVTENCAWRLARTHATYI